MEALITLLFFLLYLLKLDKKLTWLFWPLAVSGAGRGGAGRPLAALYGALRFSSPVEAGGRFAVTLMSSHLFSSSFNLPVVLVYVSVAEFHKFH